MKIEERARQMYVDQHDTKAKAWMELYPATRRKYRKMAFKKQCEENNGDKQ